MKNKYPGGPDWLCWLAEKSYTATGSPAQFNIRKWDKLTLPVLFIIFETQKNHIKMVDSSKCMYLNYIDTHLYYKMWISYLNGPKMAQSKDTIHTKLPLMPWLDKNLGYTTSGLTQIGNIIYRGPLAQSYLFSKPEAKLFSKYIVWPTLFPVGSIFVGMLSWKFCKTSTACSIPIPACKMLCSV